MPVFVRRASCPVEETNFLATERGGDASKKRAPALAFPNRMAGIGLLKFAFCPRAHHTYLTVPYLGGIFSDETSYPRIS